MEKEMDMVARFRIINRYIDKASTVSEKKIRSMKVDDYKMISKYREIYRQLGIIIAEVSMVVYMVRKLDNPDFLYVASNLSRAVNSLKRQRNKAYAIRATFYVVKPNSEEYFCLKMFLLETKSRVDYIRAITIPENLEYTPLKEYLEIQESKSIAEDLRGWFTDIAEIADAQDPEMVTADYLNHVLKTVRESGRMADYENRLALLPKGKKERKRRRPNTSL